MCMLVCILDLPELEMLIRYKWGPYRYQSQSWPDHWLARSLALPVVYTQNLYPI